MNLLKTETMDPIYLFVAEGSEELEALGTADILRRAGLDAKIVSITGDLVVKGAHGIKFQADMLIDDADFNHTSMIVLPGGLPGAYNLADCAALREGILVQYKANKPLAAICAAPLVYGRMGLLENVKATCYPGFENELKGACPTGELATRDGNFVTGKGPAAVFEFGGKIVELLLGSNKACATLKAMMYD